MPLASNSQKPGQAPASAAATILSFPTAYSAGSLYRLVAIHNDPETRHIGRNFFAAARGNVAVPRGTNLGLALSYQGGEDLTFLNHLPPGVVVYLKLERLAVTDQLFGQLKCLGDLKGLDLIDTDITDRGFQQVKNCQNLDYLALRATVLSGKSLAVLSKLHGLRWLEMEENVFDDSSMSNLSALTNLRGLKLIDVHITDVGLKHLANLTQLRELSLAVNQITDVGLQSLIPLKNLAFLNLTDTKISPKCVDVLAKLPGLKEVSVSAIDFRPDQLAAMQKKMPHCHIIDGKNTGADLRVFNPLH